MKIAFLAFTYSYSATARRPGCCPHNLGFVRKQVKAARRAVDFVVVSIHDGLEYVDYPSRELMTWFRGWRTRERILSWATTPTWRRASRYTMALSCATAWAILSLIILMKR